VDVDLFLARRAQLALERLGDRYRILPRVVGSLRWRPWLAYAVVAAAFLVGFAVDRVGASQRINVLAPPVLVLLVWNLAVYAAIAMGYVIRYGDASVAGPLRRAVMRLATRAPTIHARIGEPLSSALVTLAADWARVAAPLYNARAARILHFAAAAFALGVIVGLYVRGIALEYRATWESTFLDPTTVRSLLAVALAPGAWVSGMAIPDVAQVSAIRAPGSENAARWLHLIAATIAMVVIVPGSRSPRAGASTLPPNAHRAAGRRADFARLLRAFAAEDASMSSPTATRCRRPASGVERMLKNVFGANADVRIARWRTAGGHPPSIPRA
jgi:hypothetical protein